jgi:excisionase family DNA binding protein
MSDELLTVEQAAAKLQMHVATVRRMLREGQLGGIKLGKKEWRVPDKSIQELIDRNTKPIAPKGE